MDFVKEFITAYRCSFTILASVFLTICYVASLYVWRSTLSRDHPTTIKRRFFSVSCMMIMAPFFCYYFMSEESLNKGDMFEQLGLRWSGLLTASIVPLILTTILFFGPLTMQFMSGIWKLYSEPMYWFSSWQDLAWVRNHVMAPLSEEWVFRACMMPLLMQCLPTLAAIFVGPLLFGIAHFHHMLEQLKAGYKFKTAFILSTFQFGYTFAFGAYSSYLFVRTGHFVAPLMAHMFCNHMGFPNLGEIFQYPPLPRAVLIINFVIGLASWIYLLNPLTDPNLYHNKVHW